MAKADQGSVFTQPAGRVALSGIDALVRLTLDQVRTDARRGLNTGMFVSGYRGSPVGMFDQALIRQQKLLLEHHIHFVDGLNEDLAATAVWGTQMLHAVPGKKFDGVTGLWYGKAPGVDRSGDALKHANYTGIDKNGGVLAVFGDDPSCKSSSLPSQSEPMLWHVGMPSLYPSNVQEILDFGLHGYLMSRLSGLWVGLKIVTNIADGHGEADVTPERLDFVTPDLEIDGRIFTPQMNLGMNVRIEALEMERSLYHERHEIARRYARANGLNRVTLPNPNAWLGIVAAGKTYVDLRQAFTAMGLTDADLQRQGVRVLKMGVLFPTDAQLIREFAQGLEEIVVVEEKRPFLEMFAKTALYGRANAPRIVGKTDEEDRPLLPHHGEFEPDTIARALLARMMRKARVESAEGWLKRLDAIHARTGLPTAVRSAWYCSGCPHNTSTQALPGSVVSAGIGCHTMAMWMGRNVTMGTHMGAEGAQWIGMAPFTHTKHIFQNIGDGTYFHSGSLAVRYAAATGVNITYKLLHNQHVSMTGGQEAMGRHPVTDIVSELKALGVQRVIVTSDQPERIPAAAGAEVWHRDRLDEAQRTLAATPGTTVLLHDQECAAELRRLRGRGQRDEPAEQVVINERVCEGCGDCGVKSNCMSVEPVQTEFGRKTRIAQSSCNKDFSCVKGFCPSFLTITPKAVAGDAGGAQKKRKNVRLPRLDKAIPAPVFKLAGDVGVHIMGIGGTGTVSVATMIATAARLDGKHAIGLDQTGLAQKGGPVISDVRIAGAPIDGAAKIGDGEADLYLGFDILNATDPKNLDKCDPRRTIAVVSTAQAPTGQMVKDRQVVFPAVGPLKGGIDRVTRRADNVYLDATQIAEGLFGDAIAANTLMVGVAWQAGALPISAEAIEEAIRAGGVGVEMGLLAFQWGRMAVVDPAFVQAEARRLSGTTPPEKPPLDAAARRIVDGVGADGELKRLLEVRVPELIAYQDAAYAQRYAELVKRAWQAEQRVDRSGFAEAVARQLYKLMAYKDEYEVARLHTDPAFLASLAARYPQGYEVAYHLAPPLLARRDPATGELQKRRYGRWVLSALRVLAKLKGLRGGPLDVFGRTDERRRERALIDEYRTLVDELRNGLDAANHETAVQLAELPDAIRGYGHVKERSLHDYAQRRDELLARWRQRRVPAGTPAAPVERDAA